MNTPELSHSHHESHFRLFAESAMVIGTIGLVSMLCDSDKVLSELHGPLKDLFRKLITKSNEREVVLETLKDIPDGQESQVARLLQGATTTRRYQRAAEKGKPHLAVRDCLFDIADALSRRAGI